MDQGREDHPKGGILCKKELGQIQARPKLQSAPVLGGGGGGGLCGRAMGGCKGNSSQVAAKVQFLT